MREERGKGNYFVTSALSVWVVCTMLFSCSKESDRIDPERKPKADSFSLKPPNDFPDDLEVLPADSGGTHVAIPLSEEEVYGHYIYLPSGYSPTGANYPLLVFLHGSGEKGNSRDSASYLNRVLVNGPPKLIEADNWAPPFPTVVVSPQCHDAAWNSEKVHQFIDEIVKEYAINDDRVYVTGISMGGNGAFDYISKYGDSSLAAAIVPIAGWGDPQSAEAFLNTPVWAFHNADDSVVRAQSSINMVEAINRMEPSEPARLTIFPTGGHNSWNKPYSSSGMGTESTAYDPYEEDIYSWLFRHAKKE